MLHTWKVRVFRHNTYQKIIKWLVKRIALRLVKVGGCRLEVTHNPDKFDHYPYCKHWEKEHCTRGKYWSGYIKDMGYRVLGSNEYEVYLEVIRVMILPGAKFPFCK